MSDVILAEWLTKSKKLTTDPVKLKYLKLSKDYYKQFGKGIPDEESDFSYEEWNDIIEKCIRKNKPFSYYYPMDEGIYDEDESDG